MATEPELEVTFFKGSYRGRSRDVLIIVAIKAVERVICVGMPALVAYLKCKGWQ